MSASDSATSGHTPRTAPDAATMAAATTVTITPTVHVPAGHHQSVIEEFLATIRSGEWSTSFGDYALHRSRVLDAVYESAREGREVSVA